MKCGIVNFSRELLETIVIDRDIVIELAKDACLYESIDVLTFLHPHREIWLPIVSEVTHVIVVYIILCVTGVYIVIIQFNSSVKTFLYSNVVMFELISN